jgi:ABC-type nitrate/sulfonate/bicarbonate transport system substrate-binding protein
VPDTIRVGTFTPSVLLRVARRGGWLREAGVEVDETPVRSSPEQFAALLDGTLDAVLTSPDNVLAYRYGPVNPLGRTADVRIVSAVDRGLGLALYSRLSPEQLRGTSFGVDVPTSGFALAMHALAASLGLGRDDYRVVALGSTPRRLRALLDADGAPECAATMLNAGNELHAEAAGYRALARVAEVCPPYLGTVLATVGPDERCAGLARALVVAASAIRSGTVDAAVVEEARTAIGLPEPLGLRYLARLKDPAEGLVPDGRVEPGAIRVLIDLRRRYGPPMDADPYGDAATALAVVPDVADLPGTGSR